MRSAWRRWLYPELARFPSERLRFDAWSRVFGPGTPHTRLASRRFAVWMLVPAFATVLALTLPRSTRGLGLSFAGVGLVGAVLAFGVGRNRTRRELRCMLVDLDVPICVRCGYDLTGCANERCPECGDELRRQRLEAVVRHRSFGGEPLRRTELLALVATKIAEWKSMPYAELMRRAGSVDRDERRLAPGLSLALESEFVAPRPGGAEEIVVIVTAIDRPPRGAPVSVGEAFVMRPDGSFAHASRRMRE